MPSDCKEKRRGGRFRAISGPMGITNVNKSEAHSF